MNGNFLDKYDADVVATVILAPEIKAAVNWWVEKLTTVPNHDAGDAMISGMANWAASKVCTPIGKREIQEFKGTLHLGLVYLCLRGSWVEAVAQGNPNMGSALRTLATDYGPDRTLRAALDAAGVDDGDLRLPIKTVMRVSPGIVEVGAGYGVPWTTVYPTGTHSA